MATIRKTVPTNLEAYRKENANKFISSDQARFSLETENQKFGNISYGAMKAIESNTLGSYTAKDDNEKDILYKYRLATSAEVKKDDGTSLGFITQEGLKAIAENNTKNYTPINADEKKAIESYVAYATQKRQEKIANYKTTATESLGNIKDEKKNVNNEIGRLNREKTMAHRSGGLSSSSKWSAKDTRTAKEKREGKSIPKSEGEKELASLKKESTRLDNEAEAMVDTINDIEKYATIVYNDKGFIGQFQANNTKGRLSQDTSQAYNDYVTSQTDANKMRAEALSALAEQFEINNKDALTTDDEDVGKLEETVRDWVAVSFANYIPQFIDQTKASIKGAAVGGATGAAVGSAVPGLGTAVGAVWGVKTGWVAGASQQMFETTRGMVFKTLIDAGYDEQTALAAANDEAFVSSIIEGAGEILSMVTLGTGKLATKLVPGAAKKITGNVVTKGVKGFVAKTGKKISENVFLKTATSVAGVTLNAIGEYAEEYSQEAVSIANERRLKNPNARGKLNLTGETISLLRNMDSETEERLHSAGTEGFRIGLMMGGTYKGGTRLGTTALDHTTNLLTGSKIKKSDANENGLVQSVVDIGLQSPENSKTNKLATKLDSSEKQSAFNVGKLSKAIKGETVNVGETYYDTKSKSYLNIVDRNDKTTTVTLVTSDGLGIAKEFSNEAADRLMKNNRYVMVANDAQTEVEQTTPTAETPSVETPPTETPAVDNTTIETPPETNEILTTVRNTITGESLTSRQIDAIISNTESKEAFTQLTGVEIKGTKSEQRAIIRNWYNNNKQTTTTVDTNVATTESPIEATTTQSTSNDISDFENMLVAKGVDNDVRQKIMSVARNIQPLLAKKGKTLQDFYNGVSFFVTDGMGVSENSTSEQRRKSYWNAVANAFNTPSNTSIDEHLDTYLSQADRKTSVVVDAIEATLKDGAKEGIFEAMEKKGLKGDIVEFAKKLREHFEANGNIDKFAEYFNDGGQEVIYALERTMDTTKESEKSTPKKQAKKATSENKKANTDAEKKSHKESVENGNVKGRTTAKNDERYSEVQTNKESERVQNSGSDEQNSESGEVQLHGRRSENISKRAGKIEVRTLEDVSESEEFQQFRRDIGNKLSWEAFDNLTESKYAEDKRLDDGYDLSEILAYDMLTNPDNELRELFSDEIAEYFNEDADVTTDSAGRKVPAEVLDKTANSVVKNGKGQLILVYHSTDKAFDKFKIGDIGFHFGSYSQAAQRAKGKEIAEPIFVRAYLNLTKPLYVDGDFDGWNAFQIAQKLSQMGVISDEEALEYLRSGTKNVAESNSKLVEILQGKEYDGIVYTNQHESVNSDSYIVFDDSQIFRLSEDNTNESTSDDETAYSLSSMGFTFFGKNDVSATEVEAMLEDGSYKEQQGYKDYVKNLVNVYMQSRGITKLTEATKAKAEIERQIEGILKVAIAAKKAGFDIFDDGSARIAKDSEGRLLGMSLEPNSDYFTSSDISTICDKTKNFTEIYEAIIKKETELNVPKGKRFFNNVDNFFILHKIMAEKGLTIPCEECYVQSMRRNLLPMAEAFIELVTEGDSNNTANKQLYDNKGKIKPSNAKKRETVREICSRPDALIKLEDLSVDMLTSAEGLARIKLQSPELYQAFNSFYGQSKPKLPREAVPFRPGELIALLTNHDGTINKTLIETIKSTGGFRLQSYSDFQIQNFTDVLQTIFEASMVGLNGHAYTKVPAFLEVTEGTNLKRNISIFMYEDDGKYEIDKKNSFPMELEDIYALVAKDDSGNTSIIAVSQNADMSAWIMANDLVGYGIPWHASGVKLEVVQGRVVKTPDGREVLGYANQQDHTAQQSEVWKTTNGKNKENTKVSKPIDIYKFWDFDNKDNLSKNELIEKNLKEYIDRCNRANYRPKFRELLMDNEDVLSNVLSYAKEMGFVSQDATIDDISFQYDEYRIPYGYYKFLGDFGMFKPDGTASSIETLSLETYDFDKAVKFFDDSKTLRENELLQQFENGKVREDYRKMLKSGELTLEQLDDIIREKRSEVVRKVVDGDAMYSLEDEEFNLDDYSLEDLMELSDEKFEALYKGLGLDEIFLEALTDDDVGELYGGDISIEDISEELNVESEKIEILIRRNGLGKSHIEENHTAVMTQERIDRDINDSGATNPTYARKYITRISPQDFIDLTVSLSHMDREKFDAEVEGDSGSKMGDVDYESALKNSKATPHLSIDRTTGQVIGHNGRHRIRALEMAGIESVEIEVEFHDDDGSLIKYNAETIPDMAISSQFNTAIETHISNIIPLNEAHREEIERTYGEKAHANAGVRYSVDDYSPTFYSHMSNTIDGMKDGKHGANSVIPYLKGKGVKDEEIKWSGIEAFLEGKKSVSKAELQEFAQGSQLQIEENVLEGDTAVTLEPQSATLDGESNDLYVMRGGEIYDSLTWDEINGFWESDALGYTFLSEDRILEYYGSGKGETRWGQYKLDGGENYREITFTMPNSDYTNQAMQAHWGEDAKGILAHARVQDFEVDGQKMLFIEEIQSDWHNVGHKKGYVGKVAEPDLSNYEIKKVGVAPNNRYHSVWALIDKQSGIRVTSIIRETEQEAWSELTDYLVREEKRSQVPDAPFRDNYHEYVLKNLIRMAAEQGYDSIGWTTADIQSARWSNEYAEGYRIEYDQDIPKFLNRYGKKWGAKVGRTPMDIGGESETTYYVDDSGNRSNSYNDLIDGILARHGISEDEFNDYSAVFVDDETIKIRNPKDGSYFDEEIRVVSEPASVWSMPITDAMKQSVLYEGQALYSTIELEGEENNNERREDLLSGNGRWGNNESTRKQSERISSFKQKNQGRQRKERQSFSEELLGNGHTREVIDGKDKYTLVNPEAYNDDMLAMVEEAEKEGIEVGFFIGNAKIKYDTKYEFKVNGIRVNDKKILVRYDGIVPPQVLLLHEKAHAKWKTSEMQSVKDTILNSLSDEEKEQILSQERYKRYRKIYKGNIDKVWEEFVADTLSGMNDYTVKYIDAVTDFWYGSESKAENSPSTYAESIDAGGKNAMYSVGRWTTDRDDSNNAKSKMDKVKEKATDVANKAIDVANKIPGVDIDHIEGKQANIADIVQMIRDYFDVPISTGKVTVPNARGIYKVQPEAIRTVIANNLPTIEHELGHHLDKNYKLRDLPSVNELQKADSMQAFLSQYPADQVKGEAVAEFVRTYLRNTNEAKELCYDFYNDFVKTLSKDDLRAVDMIANVSNEYLSSTFSERVQSSIVSGNQKEKTTLSEKAKKMHADWIDGFSAIKDVTEYVEESTGISLDGRRNAYTLATNSRNAAAIANFNTVHGFRNINGNIVQGAKSFIECIADVNKKDLNTLDEYLVLKHSLEWIAPEHDGVTKKRVFGDDTLEDVDAIKNRIAEIEKSNPEMKQAAENLYEYQRNMLKHIVLPAGGMTANTFQSLYEKYPCYVPFYRAVGDNKSAKTKGTFANQKSPLKRAKGSGELIISPLESIINNTDKMVKFALRNQTMQVLANYANTVEGFGKFIEKVPPDMLPHITDITQMKETFENELQQVVSSSADYFAVSDLLGKVFDDFVIDYTPKANANKKIVTVLNNGKFSYYQVHDNALYEAIAEFTPQQLEGVWKISHDIMQVMKLLITQNNPVFGATNAVRDIGTAYKHSSINNPIEFAKRYVVALKEVITRGEAYKRWQAMGGGHNSELSANIDQLKIMLRQVSEKDMGKARRLLSAIVHPVATIASLNDYIESTPRLMEFMRTLESGGDLQKAIFNADDITTNFKKSGKGIGAKQVNAAIMFNNAALQGLNKAYRTLTNKNTTERNKTLLKWALSALFMTAIQMAWNSIGGDDDDYENLSSYKKNSFYNFAIGDGKFISIPKARETALLDSFTERTIELVFGNDDAFYEFGTYALDQLLPPMLPNTLHPLDAVHDVAGSTVLGGIMDVGWNKNYMDVPIESAYDKYLPSNERYNEKTSALAYNLGQSKLARKMDLSPKKIDHLLSSYLGVIGQVNKAALPKNESSRDLTMGLRNKFVSDANYSTDVMNKLYDNKDKALLEWQYDNNVDNAIEYEQNAVITSYISGMNKAIKALPEDEQREGRKYLLKTLNNWNYELTTQQQKMQDRLEGESVDTDYIFDDMPSSKLEWTVNKQKYTYQMTPQEYDKYIQDYLKVIEATRKQYGNNSLDGYAKAKEAARDYMSKYKKGLTAKYQSKATKVAK